jgi:RHS repeat-associated protein
LILSNSEPVSHTWDENGSLIQKATPSGTENQHPYDNQSYFYDAANRLTEIQDWNGNQIASYQYDPLGRRIRKTIHRVWDTNAGAWETLSQPETHTYFYADEGLVAEYKANGTNSSQLIAEYGWEPDGLWGTNPQWIRTKRQDSGTQSETFYYQNDHLGTPQKVIDQSGNVVWQQTATAFGETKIDETSAIINNLRFPGQYYDRETNTHYNFFRDYDLRAGRYWQIDPIGLKGGINGYAYVNLKPVSNVDVSGLIDFNGLIGDSPRRPGLPPASSRKGKVHVNRCTIVIYYGHGLSSSTKDWKNLSEEDKNKSDVPYDITNDECSAAEVFGCNTGRYVSIEKPVNGAVCPMDDRYGNLIKDYEGLINRARNHAKSICGNRECCDCSNVTIYFYNTLPWWQKPWNRRDFAEIIPCGR